GGRADQLRRCSAMRIAVTSDLHLPKTPASAIEELAAEVKAFTPDALVLAGDLGESSADFEPCLSFFRPLTCPVLVLADNHDLFPDGVSTWRLWTQALPETVRRLGFHWLEDNPFIHGEV